MKQYTSQQQQIRHSAQNIYELMSKFSNLTPVVQGKVDEWEATDDSCSFVVKGFKIGLKMDELIPCKSIKVSVDGDNSPIHFALWMQLKEVEPGDTRMRLVLEIKLTMMMKMMFAGKIQGGLDELAEQIAQGLNAYKF